MNINNWSLQYCRDVFELTGRGADTWGKSETRFFRPQNNPAAGLSAEVTRLIGPRHGLDIDPISFVVESTRGGCGNSRFFFIRFNEDHVASIVDVLKVIQPRAMGAELSYKRTMQFRTIYSTREALQRTEIEYGNSSTGLLGRADLAQLLEHRSDCRGDPELYHSGDCVQFGDIRSLIGVIKWFPDAFQSKLELPRRYFGNYPRADLIRVGAPFSQECSHT